MSTSSVNVQFVAGGGEHPSTWTVDIEGLIIGCEVGDHAPLKDCTVVNLKQGPNRIGLGGYAPATSWWPKAVHVAPLISNREFWKRCSVELARHL